MGDFSERHFGGAKSIKNCLKINKKQMYTGGLLNQLSIILCPGVNFRLPKYQQEGT